MKTRKALVMVTTLFTLAGTPALACGGGARAVWVHNIDRALTVVKLSPADMARVKELREQIFERQKLGDPDGAASAEAEAMKIMGYHHEQRTRGGCGTWVRNTD
jgi:hypothetical protein